MLGSVLEEEFHYVLNCHLNGTDVRNTGAMYENGRNDGKREGLCPGRPVEFEFIGEGRYSRKI